MIGPSPEAIMLEVGYVQGDIAVVRGTRHARPREVPEVITMPRSVDDILQHAAELASRFEDYQPDPADELDASAIAALRSAVLERSGAERHLLEAVRQARRSGMSWSAIGTLVGTSGEAARQRYADKVA